MPPNTHPRRWFVTGASRGFGRAICEAALATGDRVIATARTPGDLPDLAEHPRCLTLPLDVTQPESAESALRQAEEEFGGIDVLVNNAGHGYVGALEELSDSQLRALLDTNVHGVATLLRAALPMLRAQGSGHIVQLSSVGGIIGNPGHAGYATSKFALEGMSEALAGEIAPFGIGVTIVEPGPFRTDFAGDSMRWSTAIADYAGTPAGELRLRFADQHGNQPNDPAAGARVIIDALNAEHPPLRLPLGPEAVDRIRVKLQSQLAELESWAEAASATRF